MSGSTIGKLFSITTWGESHGEALGVIVDGCPAGLSLSANDIQPFLDRRKPGQGNFSTKRNESDLVTILSGTFEGKTTGTPISLMVKNSDHHSADYSNIKDVVRPGHADYTFNSKYGIRDYRGGGRSSGRETIGRVAAGAIAVKILKELGVTFTTYVKSVGDFVIDYNNFDINEINNNELYMPDRNCYENAKQYLEKLVTEGDSIGSTVECIISNVPKGLGDPVFDKLDANLSKAVMSIGAVKAVEIGDGVEVSHKLGSENNDNFNSKCKNFKQTNHSGGILGGISDGSDIIIRATIKPTPSIYKEQQTIDKDYNDIKINIKGRHDPIIGPRASVVVESMCAITILDSLMCNMSAKLDNIISIYS